MRRTNGKSRIQMGRLKNGEVFRYVRTPKRPLAKRSKRAKVKVS
jgi:hypothetical protein